MSSRTKSPDRGLMGNISGNRISRPANRISNAPRTRFMIRITRGVINILSLSASFAFKTSVENTVPTIEVKKTRISFEVVYPNCVVATLMVAIQKKEPLDLIH